ncbi:MAG: helix-turn-helix transcriptional regulator, partial [Thermoguttaceae bacterium]
KTVKQLLAFRALRGLSQAEVASRMQTTQSRVSKLENSTDNDLRVGDLRKYAAAVDCGLSVGVIPKETKPVDTVKRHAFAIKRHMEDLARLAASDKTIASGVTQFFGEVVYNITRMLAEAVRHLPLRDDDKPYFSIKVSEIQSVDSEDAGAQGDPAVERNERATF